jgi:hypothetical protein
LILHAAFVAAAELAEVAGVDPAAQIVAGLADVELGADHPSVFLRMDQLQQMQGLEDSAVVGEGVAQPGGGPAGYDAALLLCVSLLESDTAAHIRTTFADILDTPTGRISQLAAAAKLLGLVEYGEHPDLAVPLHHHARHIIGAL